MQFYKDSANANGEYSYATFEEGMGGAPIFVSKKSNYLIIPVINQGIYNLPVLNKSEDPIYFDRSYYFFKGVAEFTEQISIRSNKTIKGSFHNHFLSAFNIENCYNYRVELEMGYNGNFYYACNWKVSAIEFGVLIDQSALSSRDEYKFFKDEHNLNTNDLDFLLNKNQIHLERFLNSQD